MHFANPAYHQSLALRTALHEAANVHTYALTTSPSTRSVQEAQNPILEGARKPVEASELRQSCLYAKKQGSAR